MTIENKTVFPPRKILICVGSNVRIWDLKTYIALRESLAQEKIRFTTTNRGYTLRRELKDHLVVSEHVGEL